MAITFFGVSSTPADAGTNTATTTVVTPPASMQEGDLVVLYAYQRGSATMSISQASGQTWNDVTGHASGTATLSADMFWCRFNGTWTAGNNPSVAFSAGTNTNVVMLVFRPSTGSNTWGLDPLSAGLNRFITFPAGTTITNNMGQIPVNDSTVGIASFMADDDNTWGSLTGTGWSQSGLGAQYRNTSGSDTSSAFAYRIKTASSAYESVALTQSTSDPGIQGNWIFYEESAGTVASPNLGVLSITAFVPVLGLAINAGLGLLSASGFAPLAQVGLNISCGLGQATATGFSPSVSVSNNQTVSLGVGAATVSGFAPTISTSSNQTVSPGVGVATLTGFLPTASATNNITVLPGLGQATLTGFSPSTVVGVNILSNLGQLTANGFAPTVSASNHQTVSVGLGQATLTGFISVIDKGINISLGQLTVQGFAPTIIIPVTVSTGKGQATLIGLDPTVFTGNQQVVFPGVGVSVVTGFSPSISITDHKIVQSGLGQALLTAFNPSVEIPTIISTDKGILTLAGFAPIILTPRLIVTDQGQLTLTGLIPDVYNFGSSPTVETGTGVLQVTGYNPNEIIVETQCGTLRLKGFAPYVKSGARMIRLHKSFPYYPNENFNKWS